MAGPHLGLIIQRDGSRPNSLFRGRLFLFRRSFLPLLAGFVVFAQCATGSAQICKPGGL
jgi:hypothetical protein